MRIIKNNENNYSNVSSSVSSSMCYHDHLQGHQVVINNAVKKFLTFCSIGKKAVPRRNSGVGPRKKSWADQARRAYSKPVVLTRALVRGKQNIGY